MICLRSLFVGGFGVRILSVSRRTTTEGLHSSSSGRSPFRMSTLEELPLRRWLRTPQSRSLSGPSSITSERRAGTCEGEAAHGSWCLANGKTVYNRQQFPTLRQARLRRPNKKHTSPQRSPLVRVFEPKRARVGVAMPWNKVIWWVILLVSCLIAYVGYVTYLQLAPLD